MVLPSKWSVIHAVLEKGVCALKPYYRMCSLATIECVLLKGVCALKPYYRMCSLATIECVLLKGVCALKPLVVGLCAFFWALRLNPEPYTLEPP
jgi:hypothetical protein